MIDSKGVDAGLLQTRYRLTKQRAAILRALEDGAHLTAETIHERARVALPAVSLGTIYRTLDILRAIGLVIAQDHRYSGIDATLVVTGRCARCAGLARNGVPT